MVSHDIDDEFDCQPGHENVARLDLYLKKVVVILLRCRHFSNAQNFQDIPEVSDVATS